MPFQAGRVRLVRLLDAVLDDLESGALGHFWLDGQTGAVDDYLAVRPEAEGRVRAVVADGRLGIGPWTVQMDEFVVSPETIVRNLVGGLRRRAELGATGPAVGYAPDVFGHVSQLPQLLRLAGIDHAVVWRGVPEVMRDSATAFRWEAPDGSVVRAEYLYGSYANGRSLPRRWIRIGGTDAKLGRGGRPPADRRTPADERWGSAVSGAMGYRRRRQGQLRRPVSLRSNGPRPVARCGARLRRR